MERNIIQLREGSLMRMFGRPIILQTGFGGFSGFLGPAEASPVGGAFASGSAMLLLTAMVVAMLVARPKIS
jgi:hypothetical protein